MDHLVYKRLRPEDAIDVPLAEIDPKVSGDTFCIATETWGQIFIHRFNCAPSFYLFHPYSPIRRSAIAFTTHFAYDLILGILILGNLLDLAIPQYMPFFFEQMSLLFYIAEALYQSISRGFIFGPYTYLRNPWMCFDFIITLLSFSYKSNVEVMKATGFQIQSWRGIRIFNIITIIPGVQTMGKAVILSISHLTGVLSIFISFLVSVAIIAKHFFSGVFLNKCVKELPYNFETLGISYEDFIQNSSNWLQATVKSCGNTTGARPCPIEYVCLPKIGKHEGSYSHFDTFGAAILNSLSLITHDEWSYVLSEALTTTGPLCALLFIPVIFFGFFCLLNLVLVVVICTYEAMISAGEVKSQKLSEYTYYGSFQFDIRGLSLYPLPTNRETLRKINWERDDIMDHRETVKNAWKWQPNFVREVLLPYGVERKAPVEKKTDSWKNFRLKMKQFSESKIFRSFSLLTISLNAIFLASEHANMSLEMEQFLYIGNVIFVVIFSLEKLILIIAVGIYYFGDFWNLLDSVVVILGIISIFEETLETTVAFRFLKLVYLLKIQREWSALNKISTVVINSFGNILRLIVVILLLMFVFAVIGNRLLGPLYIKSKLKNNRWSFYTFYDSLFMVLWIFSGEWIYSLLSCLDETNSSILCPVIFISYSFIGNLVIINLFVALLLRSFNDCDLHLSVQKKPVFIKKCSSFIEKHFSQFCLWKKKNSKNKANDNGQITKKATSESNFENNQKSTLLYIKKFIRSNNFEILMNVVIVSSIIVSVLHDADIDESPELHEYFTVSTYIFTIIFVLEMFFRWFATGFINYFTNIWTLFDFVMIVVSVTEDVLYVHDLAHTMTGLDVLRALRAVRLLSKWQEMKIIISALILSMPGILYSALIIMVIWLPFGIMGINFFAGRFYSCIDPNNYNGNTIRLNKTDCLQQNFTWRNSFYNFDHIGNSYLSLFNLAMMAGWDALVEKIIDYRGPDMHPEKDYYEDYYYFVIVFIAVGGFFSLNLFVGIIIDTYKQMRKEIGGGDFESKLTETQRNYYHAMLKFSRRKPTVLIIAPSNKFRNSFYVICHSWWFRVLILFIICANTVVAAIELHDNPLLVKIRTTCERIFTVVYCMEFLIKILGLGKFYFKNYWNTFDLIILLLYLLGETIHLALDTSFNMFSFVYAFRILQIIHLLQFTEIFVNLRLLTYTIAASFKSLLHISILLCIIILIYSVIGMSLFKHVKPTGLIDDFVNFRTLISSAFLLFRLTTAEEWQNIYSDLSIKPPDCVIEEEFNNCGNQAMATIYIFSYIFLTNHILTNIFIAIILDNYKQAMAEEKFIFKEDNLTNFYEKWKNFDPKATQFIPYENLPTFLNELNSQLRIAMPNQIALSFMDLPVTAANKVHCLDVLKGIMKVKFGNVEDTPLFRFVCSQMQLKYEKMFPNLKGSRFVHTTMNLKRMDRAARIIQTRVKEFISHTQAFKSK
ncbi:sodium channel protein type 4 subunit alpha B [Trichonephila inaurata madagascariensis]|uniref:Calcium-channel protein CCH1 n=1 Tax=Trichonephila inaurata madagascariensis TaxID=2747483 RepID=A0A8X7BNS5_9ARAC|nr:sodium channel protein type 4 subunit alpha B [Trichonephila inaurata madagascariensis]